MSEPRRLGTLRRGGLTLAAVIACAGLLLAVFQGLTSGLRLDDDDLDAAYHGVAVERGNLRETVMASGTLEPLVRVPVISEVSGIITTVHVEVGERVHRGQPLFELDRMRLEARVAGRRAELELRRANARYDLVGRSRVERDHLRSEHARVQSLFERNVASEIDLERAAHVLALAEIGVGDAAAETAARRAAVAQARELLRQAQRDLDNATVRAPIDGVVIARDGEVGRAVADVTRSGGTVIAVIADDQRIRLVAEVDENDIARLRVGQPALVAIDAFPDEEFPGSVRKLSPAGTTVGKVSNFEIEVQLERDERLRVGMSCDARVVVHEHQAVLLIPNLAIVRNGGAPEVKRVDGAGDRPSRPVRVLTGYSDGFQTIVEEGLSEGDVILVRNDEA